MTIEQQESRLLSVKPFADRSFGAPLSAARITSSALILLSVILLVATVVSQLQVVIYTADLFIEMRWGLGLDPDNPVLLKIQTAAAANCGGNDSCVKHTRLLMLSNLSWNYPINALVSQALPYLVKEHPFLEATAIIAVTATLLMLAAAVPLYWITISASPPLVRFPIALLAATTALIGLFRGIPPIAMPELMENPHFFWTSRLHLVGLWATAFGFLAAPLVLRARYRTWLIEGLSPAWRWALSDSGVITLLFLAVIVLVVRLTVGINAGLQIISIILWATTLAFFLLNRLPLRISLAMALVLFSTTAMQFFYFYTAHPTPLGALSLATTGIIFYACFRPNGRLVWLFPLVMLFHIGTAGILSVAFIVTEGIFGVIRRRVTLLLAPAILTAFISRYWSATHFQGQAQHFDIVGLLSALVELTNQPSLFVSPIIVVGTLAFAAILLVRRNGEFDPTARLALIALQVAALNQLSEILLAGGVDPNDWNYSLFIYAGNYLGAALGFSAPLIIYGNLLWNFMAKWPNTASGNSTSPETAITTPVKAEYRRAIGLVLASYVFLIVGRTYSPAHMNGDFRDALIRGAWIVADPAGIRPHDPTLGAVHLDDDDYLLRRSPEPRANDPLSFATLLKLTLRQKSGMLDPMAATISILDIKGDTDWWARHSRTADHIRVDDAR